MSRCYGLIVSHALNIREHRFYAVYFTQKSNRHALARPESGTRAQGGGSVTSMAISDEDIQKVREASDLVAIMGETGPVKQRGRDFWLC